MRWRREFGFAEKPAYLPSAALGSGLRSRRRSLGFGSLCACIKWPLASWQFGGLRVSVNRLARAVMSSKPAEISGHQGPWSHSRRSLWTTLTRALFAWSLGKCGTVRESHEGSDGRGLRWCGLRLLTVPGDAASLAGVSVINPMEG